jgi:hypothetical protein
VTARGVTRIAIALAAVTVLGGALTGCAHGGLADRQVPTAGVGTTSTSPAPVTGSDDSTLQSVGDDLDAANSATNNAGGDVTDADRSAATSDAP